MYPPEYQQQGYPPAYGYPPQLPPGHPVPVPPPGYPPNAYPQPLPPPVSQQPQPQEPNGERNGDDGKKKEESNQKRSRTGLYIIIALLALILGVGVAVGLIFVLNGLGEDDEQPAQAAGQGNTASPMVPTAPTAPTALAPPTGVVTPAPIPVTPSPTKAPVSSAPTASPTRAPVPTMAPTTILWEFLLETLQIADVSALDENELLALEWMATEDPLRDSFLDASGSPNINTVEANIRAVETRYALTLFYYSTGGTSTWIFQNNFLSASPSCEWDNGAPVNSELFQGVFCFSDAPEVAYIVMCKLLQCSIIFFLF